MSRKKRGGGKQKLPIIQPPPCSHRGELVKVGGFTIFAGGTMYLLPEDLRKADILIPLTSTGVPWEFGGKYQVLAAPLVDYGGVPNEWREFLAFVARSLARREKFLAFCQGSHGRTGCFLGSLIAMLESPTETPDPIAAVRERHCIHAVETLAQAEAIFALRGQVVPDLYRREFAPKTKVGADTPQPVIS